MHSQKQVLEWLNDCRMKFAQSNCTSDSRKVASAITSLDGIHATWTRLDRTLTNCTWEQFEAAFAHKWATRDTTSSDFQALANCR
jgi:hypothetical protein